MNARPLDPSHNSAHSIPAVQRAEVTGNTPSPPGRGGITPGGAGGPGETRLVPRIRPTPAGSAGPGGPPRPRTAPRDLSLGAAELRGILRLLEDAERAQSLAAFREAVVDGLARHLNYRHTAIFIGPTIDHALQDRNAVGRGLAMRMAEPFFERYRNLEALTNPESLRAVRERGIATLEDLGIPERPEVRLRLERFLRANGIHAKMLVRLTTPANIGAVISLMDPRPGLFGPRDRAVAAVLGRHLGSLLRFHVRSGRGPAVTAKLSARERDVVRLVAEGQSNRQVAAELCISIDTVKHHLTHALVATGCSNRTQLALAWQREMGASPVDLPR